MKTNRTCPRCRARLAVEIVMTPEGRALDLFCSNERCSSDAARTGAFSFLAGAKIWEMANEIENAVADEDHADANPDGQSWYDRAQEAHCKALGM